MTEAKVAESDLTISHQLGLHARPAALFVRTAQRFACDITVGRADRTANAKSIVRLLALGVSQGVTVRVRAEGPDAEEALSALQQLVDSNFGEP